MKKRLASLVAFVVVIVAGTALTTLSPSHHVAAPSDPPVTDARTVS